MIFRYSVERLMPKREAASEILLLVCSRARAIIIRSISLGRDLKPCLKQHHFRQCCKIDTEGDFFGQILRLNYSAAQTLIAY